MRHIKFDESSVLTEFAKIAYSKGFIKEASDSGLEKTAADPFASLEAALDGIKGATMPMAQQLKQELQMYKKDGPAAARQALMKRWKGEWAQLIAQHLPAQAPATPAPANPLMALSQALGGVTGPKQAVAQKLKAEVDAAIKKGAAPDEVYKKLMAQGWKGEWAKLIGQYLSAAPSAEQAADDLGIELGQPTVHLDLDSIAKQLINSAVKKSPKGEAYVDLSVLERLASQWRLQNRDKYSDIADKLKELFGKIRDQLNMRNKANDPRAANMIQQFYANLMNRVWAADPKELQYKLDRSSSVKDKLVAAAKGDKHYDVTGETGEQLVDKAHPGGGTKTELTHSKTDENLVETIVEQQKRDVEVVNKIPKGVYAALAKLANELDQNGLYAEASEIDGILLEMKKKIKVAESAQAQQYKRDMMAVLEAIPVESKAHGQAKEQMIRDWSVMKIDTLSQAVTATKSMAVRWRYTFPTIVRSMMTVYNSYEPEIERERAMTNSGKNPAMEVPGLTVDLSGGGTPGKNPAMEVPGLTVDLSGGGAADETLLEPDLESIPSQRDEGISGDETPMQQRRRRWARQYNKSLDKIETSVRKQFGLRKVKPDGNATPEYVRALKMVRQTNAKTLADFVRIMNSKAGPVREMPPMPGEEPRGLPKPPTPMVKTRYQDVYPQLVAKYNQKFDEVGLRLRNNPGVVNYLRQQAKSIADQYNSNPNAVPKMLDMWMNQTLSGLTKEDILRLQRG